MTIPDDPMHALWWWIDDRRAELGMTLDAFSESSGLSRQWLYDVRDGKTSRLRTTTKKTVERALRWAPGSVDAILRGGPPTPIGDRTKPLAEWTRPEAFARAEEIHAATGDEGKGMDFLLEWIEARKRAYAPHRSHRGAS